MSDRQTPTYDICIVGGCGHVGLPLGLAFATRGKRVVLFDINAAVVEQVNRGEMPFMDVGADEALSSTIHKTLFATTVREVIAQSSVVVTVTGTPVDPHLNPDVHSLHRVISELEPHLRDGQLFVLRSTVYPGVSEHIGRTLRDLGKNVDIAFCPERVAEGYALEEIISLPQIVAGLTPEATARASELFSLITDKLIVLSPVEAELAKLFSNTWRYINFAVANQFYMLAAKNDLDFYRISQAMTQDYPRMRGFPRPGFAAGPCLFKDTMQLSAYSANNFFLGHSAMLVNEGLPNFVIAKLKEKVPLRELTVGIAGMAFKANIDDPRDSLSYKLRKVLRLEARRVLCSDPFVKDPSFVDLETLVRESDVVVLGVPHSVYKDLYKDLESQGKRVVDVWNFFGQGGLI